MSMITRPATPADAPAIQAIYGHHVLHGFGTFEEVPPTTDDIASRIADVTARGLPWVVAVDPSQTICGYAYAAPFRARAAYRFTVEDSVYIAPEAQRRGAGRAVLSAVIDACEALGMKQMLGVIGGSDNVGSIGLHEALGFSHTGVLRAVGFKRGRWVDVVMMQRELGA